MIRTRADAIVYQIRSDDRAPLRANEMMNFVNDAFDKVRKEKRTGFSDNGYYS